MSADLDILMGFRQGSRFVPHGYQAEAIEMKASQPGFGLLWDMGLGKTGTILEILERSRHAMLPCLLVAPLRCCTDVWPLEIKKFGYDFETSIIHGDPQTREKALRRKADIHLINPENVVWLVEYLGRHKRMPFSTLVIDESTKFKNPGAKRLKALAKIVPHFSHRMILTGTPIPRGYPDLWSQVYLLDQGAALGPKYKIFEMTYFSSDGWGNLKLLPGAKEEIDKRIAHLVHRGDACELLQMPQLIENEILVEQPKEALSRIDEILSGFVQTGATKGLGRPSAASMFSAFDAMSDELFGECGDVEEEAEEGFEILNAYAALRTVCSGFQYFPIMETDPGTGQERKVGRTVDKIHENKLGIVEDVIEGIGGKNILIAFNFHEEREQLVRRFSCPVIDSQTTNSQASEYIRNWCAGNYPVMSIQPKSVGHGINLQAGGHHLLWYSPPNSLDDFLQTNARLYRQGQTSGSVTIHKIISKGTVEVRVSAMLAAREMDQQSLLDALLSASR